jgi:hypothetical protein
MSERKGLDLNKLTIIDASEVPTKAKRHTQYRDLLKQLRKGKALVISDNEANIDTIRAGIRRQQEHGDFKRIVLAQRTNEQGVRVLYVINPSEEQTEKKTS